MPAISTITINDGKSTPLAHAFAPVTTTGTIANWAERLGLATQLWPTLSNQVVITNSRAPVPAGKAPTPNRVVWKIEVPVYKTVEGIDVLDHFSSASVNFYFSPSATEAERKDIRALVSNLLLNANVIASIEKVEPNY